MKKIILLIALVFSFNANAISDKNFTLKEIEKYMGSLTSFTADFEQIVPGEEYSRGKLYVKKPGRFLWNYQLPTPVKLVSNGGMVYFVDEESYQVTQVPNTGILFSLLSKEVVNFNNEFLRTVSLKQNNKRINLDLIATVDNNKVPVTLIFQKLKGDKLELMKIISQNQLEQMVMISLFNHDEKAIIDKDIFKVELHDEF